MCTFSHRVSTDSRINETVGKLTSGDVIFGKFGMIFVEREREREREK
jgi:hypothetical protein